MPGPEHKARSRLPSAERTTTWALLILILFPLWLGRLWADPANPSGKDDTMEAARLRMVETQIVARDVTDARVLAAMRKVERHCFVPFESQSQAYEDRPLRIGYGQTISQPYIVAKMSELLNLKGTEKVLEIGTGSGYQAAILAELAKDVYSIEISQPLCNRAKKRLEKMNYRRLHVRCGDGYHGWPEAAPFDAIIVTAAPTEIPQPIFDQLKPGGRMVIPVGDWQQELLVIRKGENGGIERRSIFPVRFVPMTGKVQKK